MGPYAKYGTPLVAACAEAGVDYCDLTGEVHWMARMISEYHEQAVASGARIVLHLLHVLERHDAKTGIATLCIGGGQGGAMLIERATG